MMTHGMSLYKNILTKDTSTKLREWILDRNKSLKEEDEIDVISNENRWSFYIGANEHPLVTKAIREVATHKVFRQALERIVGKDPAIIEMTAITSAYGAEDQFWHHDIVAEGSPAKYGRSFIPSYSLFMTLQDTTAAMGATDVCPGTYMCSNSDADRTCSGLAFQVSGSGIWEQGAAIFMNQQSFHRGAAHVDPNGPHRSLFIITFAPRPMDIRYETRLLGQGGSYSLRWDNWGHTLNDFEHSETKMRQPWTTLKSLGIYKPKGSHWGWDWISQNSMRIANEDTGYGEPEKLDEFVDSGGFRLPKIFTVKLMEGMTWRDYFSGTTTRCKELLGKAAIIGNGIFVSVSLVGAIIVRCVGKRNSSVRTPIKSVFRLFIRVAMYDLLVAAVGLAILDHLTRSGWARSIKARTLYSSPFNNPQFVSDHRPIAVVYNTDVLVSDRLDFKNLGSMADLLDFQGGNIKFKSTVRGASKMVDHLKTDEVKRLVETIMHGMKREGSRLLLHNEVSDWVVLGDEDAAAYTTQEIMLEANPLMHALEKESKFLLSSYKHGLRYKGAMAHKHSPWHINTIIAALMDNAGIPSIQLYSFPNLLTQEATITMSTKATKSSSLRPPRRFTVANRATQAFERTTSSLPSNVTISDRGMLVLGDIVDAQYKGLHNEYYKGKIVGIGEGATIEVQYADGEQDQNLQPWHLHKFIPYTVGETLEVETPEDGSFWPGKVLHIYENNDVVIVTSEGNVRVPPSKLKRVKAFKVGDIVGASFRESDGDFMATVVKKHIDNTVDLHFHYGERSNRVHPEEVRKWYRY